MKPHINLLKISLYSLYQIKTYQDDEQSRQKLGTFLENKVCTLKVKVSLIFFKEKNQKGSVDFEK